MFKMVQMNFFLVLTFNITDSYDIIYMYMYIEKFIDTKLLLNIIK